MFADRHGNISIMSLIKSQNHNRSFILHPHHSLPTKANTRPVSAMT